MKNQYKNLYALKTPAKQPTNQENNQPTKKSTNQPTNQETNQPTNLHLKRQNFSASDASGKFLSRITTVKNKL